MAAYLVGEDLWQAQRAVNLLDRRLPHSCLALQLLTRLCLADFLFCVSIFRSGYCSLAQVVEMVFNETCSASLTEQTRRPI